MSMEKKNKGKVGNQLFKVGDAHDSEVFFVVDEVCSEHGNSGSEEDEPEVVFVKEDKPVCLKETISNSKNEPEVIFFQDVSGMFCLDTTPDVAKEKQSGPRFTREFSSILKSEEDAVDSTGDTAKQDNRCFNCLGDHSLTNCPNPKNQKEISKNRSLFLKQQPARMNRYHVDKPSKFDNFTPGVISKELRDALGLRRSEIPLHVYQMRILGYPPGWIEHIKEYSSGLEVIDTASSPSSTEGNQKFTYDYDRIIDYPGFNVPVDRLVHDDWRNLNFPPMQEHNSKGALIANLKMHNKTQIVSSEESGTNLEIIDMDTSIEDLEEQRQALLAELEEEDDDCVIEESDLEGNETPTNKVTSNDLENTAKESESQNLTNETLVEEITTDRYTSSASNVPSNTEKFNSLDFSPKKSKLLAMGTPVSIRHSPYNILPTLDKFAQNGKLGTMGELELYENLPNSTGAFQRMRSLLKKAKQMFNKK